MHIHNSLAAAMVAAIASVILAVAIRPEAVAGSPEAAGSPDLAAVASTADSWSTPEFVSQTQHQ